MSLSSPEQSTKIILGIETSCDETALCLMEVRGFGAGMKSDEADDGDGFECRVTASLVHSQAELHSAYGGVFPSLAKREHGKNLVPLLHKLFIQASEETGVQGHGISLLRNPSVRFASRSRKSPSPQSPLLPDFNKLIEKFRTEIAPQNPELFESFAGADFLKNIPDIDMIAVTEGPGLEPALWVGITFARMLSEMWSIPVHAVNHMEGHVVASLLPSDITNGVWHKLHELPLPAIALLISGGHTELVKVEGIGEYKILGETVDDAVGEAFDKTARLLGLPYPGGPHVSLLAQKARDEGVVSPVKLPRPMISSGDMRFSFSGLKTAVLYAVRTAPKNMAGEIDEVWKKGLTREFEDAVTETLVSKLRFALDETGAGAVIVGGGVAANKMIREALGKLTAEYEVPLLLPSPSVSGDNAVMIALAAALSETQTPGSIRAQGTKRLSE